MSGCMLTVWYCVDGDDDDDDTSAVVHHDEILALHC